MRQTIDYIRHHRHHRARLLLAMRSRTLQSQHLASDRLRRDFKRLLLSLPTARCTKCDTQVVQLPVRLRVYVVRVLRTWVACRIYWQLRDSVGVHFSLRVYWRNARDAHSWSAMTCCEWKALQEGGRVYDTMQEHIGLGRMTASGFNRSK